jgi:murein DD-endopeptidase MepM/ murein hydrolase activator NlpD
VVSRGLRDRLRNPAPWLGNEPRRYSGRPSAGRGRFGLLDAVVVAVVLLAVWSQTPIGAVFDRAIAQMMGAPTDGMRPLTAYFDTGDGSAQLIVALAEQVPIIDDGVPSGGLPQPWRTAAAAALGGPLPGQADAHLARARVNDPDATVLDVLDALYDDDPGEALEVFAVGAELRQRAIGRARAAGVEQPEDWHNHRSYLPLRARLAGDRVVGRVLALGTALDLTWPIAIPHVVTSGYGERVHPVLKSRRFHNGVDLAVPIGTPILAAQAGRARVGEDHVSGKYVVIEHGHGVRTSYCHLDEILVQRGERVEPGTRIARSGNTGRSTGPHLHFVVRIGKHTIDPAALRRRRAPQPGS